MLHWSDADVTDRRVKLLVRFIERAANSFTKYTQINSVRKHTIKSSSLQLDHLITHHSHVMDAMQKGNCVPGSTTPTNSIHTPIDKMPAHTLTI